MKKLSTALLLSTAFMATGAQAHWQGSWLLGVSAGGAWHSSDDNVNVAAAVPAAGLFVSTTVNNNTNDNQFIWGFLGGYQARCNEWLAGLEVNVDWRNHHNDDTTFVLLPGTATQVNGTISRDRDPVWGFTARLGYFTLPCFMPYIRLGADYSSHDLDFSVGDINGIIEANNNFGNHKWGFVGGIGVEYIMPMLAGLSLRAEWDYHTRHQHDDTIQFVDTRIGTPVIFGASGLGHSHENTARASLVYNFPV